MLKTIGGDRLGSGNRMKAAMHNYERSTHDLGNVWRSTMAPGVLVPCYKKLCQNGDTWTIDLKALVRTIPANGPLFGSYKLQIDTFEIPIRLYQAILHNNMTKIGMDMSKVKLPKIQLYGVVKNPKLNVVTKEEFEFSQVASSSLMRYLGVKGIGNCIFEEEETPEEENPFTIVDRKFNAVPVLAYYDIFKNYYSNKQEENAYIIDTDVNWDYEGEITNILTQTHETDSGYIIRDFEETDVFETIEIGQNPYDSDTSRNNWQYAKTKITGSTREKQSLIINEGKKFRIMVKDKIQTSNYVPYLEFIDTRNSEKVGAELDSDAPVNYGFTYTWQTNENGMEIDINITSMTDLYTLFDGYQEGDKILLSGVYYEQEQIPKDEVQLKQFPLENIDKMRMYLLTQNSLGTEANINNFDYLPYNANWKKKADNKSGCSKEMNGLVCKTYQSDLFNNWLSSEWIDGINGINAISAVAVESGKFTIDALNLAHKVYNMLNRIAVSGGTYEDWQEAVYGEDALRRAESPIYCGGMSGTIAFEEVISTADTETTNAGDQPLGSLAGKGTLVNANGGNIEIHIKEPSYIMCIASITPLIDYYQGNDFDMTELDTLNDIHKPELDQIGFQDLMLERGAWWSVEYDEENQEWIKKAGGKTPAWIEYMTSYNEVFGDFAVRSKLGYMVLTRDYKMGKMDDNWAHTPENSNVNETLTIADWTTYINPTGYNYQFADNKLTAQNFWVQIGINATVRRKISAKVIPNL